MMKIELNPVLCGCCGSCVTVCPTDAIRLHHSSWVELVNEECVGCGWCEKVCPVGALEKGEKDTD